MTAQSEPYEPPRERAAASRWRPDGWALGASLLALIVALPILAVITLALGPTTELIGEVLATVLPRYTLNTLALMALVGAGVMVIGAGTAWLVTMCRFPGRALFEWALLLPLAVPAYVIAFIYVDLTDAYFELRTLPGAAAMMTLVLYPYVFLLARTAFLDQSVSAIEVGRTLGYGPWRAAIHISLPLARPALAIGLALALMEVVADFGTVAQFGIQTFTTGIYDVWLGMNSAAGAARLACGLLAVVLMLIWLERSSRRGRRYHPAGRHFRDLPGLRLSGLKAAAAFAACAAPLLLGFVIPAMVLIKWALATAADARLMDLAADLANTLTVAAIAALLAVICALYLSYALRISGGPVLRAATRLAAVGYALPGSVIAVGVLAPLAWFDNSIDAMMRAAFGISTGLLLSGTVAMLIFAYLARFMAMSLGAVSASLGRVTRDMDAAARTLGRGPWRTLGEVHLPLIRGGLLAALLLVFVEVVKELPATLILRPFNFSTLATRVFEYASDERFEETGLWALAIVAAGLIPVIILSRSIGRSRPGHSE